jgi:cytochrome P450
MLLVAGNETTTKFLTETVRLVAEQPGGWPALRARPEQIPALVEEGLRISAPTQGSYRIAAVDTELGGVTIPEGARVVVMFSAANRDPALFSCPHEFQPDRANAREHLAFGKGIHFCVGAALSRMEGNVAFERLVDRVADVRLASDNTFEYTPSFMLRGLKRLSIEIDLA